MRKRKNRAFLSTLMIALILFTTIFQGPALVYANEQAPSQPEQEPAEDAESPEEKPALEVQHEQPQELSPAEDFLVHVTSPHAETVTLFYKSTPNAEPVTVEMERENEETYAATIPSSALWSADIEYWFVAENEQEEVETDAYTVTLGTNTESEADAAPKLLMTEVNLSEDAHPFIEVYNNTNQPIQLEDYILNIQGEDFTLPDATINKEETIVISDSTASDFNNHYDSSLAEEQMDMVEALPAAANDSSITLTEKEAQEAEVTAIYNQSETAASQILYYAGEREMSHGAFAADARPGTLIAGQAPAEVVHVEGEDVPSEEETEVTDEETASNEEDAPADEGPSNEEEASEEEISSTEQEGTEEESSENETNQENNENNTNEQEQPAIEHSPTTQIDGETNLTLEAVVPNAANVTLNYQSGSNMEVQELAFTQQEETDNYAIEIPSTAFWSPDFNYQIIAEDESGETFTYPENDYIEAEVSYTNQPDTQSLPPLLITEITPNTANLNGADGYEFIEIYNNSDQPINMEDYKIIYRYPTSTADQIWNLTDDKVIEPQESFIVWIHNDGNQDKTVADFNAQYGLNLTEDKVTIVESGGMANGSERTLILADAFNNEIVQASYNDGADDVFVDQGIQYQYPREGTSMHKVGLSETITPLSIIPGQVPSEPVAVDTDAAVPVIGEPSLSTTESDITVEVDVTSGQDLLGMNMYVRQSSELDFQTLPMEATDDPSVYAITIPREAIWSDRVQYYFQAANQAGETTTDIAEMDVPQSDLNYESIPPLLVTEVVPDTTNSGGADGYEFIEVYNNTTEAIDFSDYTMRYRYPNSGPAGDLLWGPPSDQEIVIPSGETVVFWVINGGNTDKTGADFNANFGSDLTEGTDLIKIHNNGMANGSERTLVMATKSGYELSYASYNDEAGVDDTVADKGIFYKYPIDGSNISTKISAGETDATPGSVLPEQVPAEKVSLPADPVDPVIEDTTNKTDITSEEPVTITANITDNNQVKAVSLYYRTIEGENFKNVNLERSEDDTYQHVIYEPELIGQNELEYYFVASDGRNEATTESKVLPIEHPNMEEGLRLNVADDDLLSGEHIIKATDDEYTEETELYMDDAQVTDTFMAMETKAYFAFDVSETNIYFKNGVTMGDETLEIFDDTYTNFTTLTVPISAERLEPGDNTITIRAGNKVGPFDETSNENRDDFTIKNIRLVLSDGTIIYDPEYSDPNTEHPIGDSPGKDPIYDFTFTLEDEAFASTAYLFDTTTVEDGAHEIQAVSGNEEIAATVLTDNTNPVIEPSIADGAEYKGEFVIDARAHDATSEVTELTAQLDGEYISMPYETSSAMLDPGAHEVVFTATDAAGNTSTETIEFTVVDEHPLLPDFLDSNSDHTSADLSVRVNDPTNDAMDVAFYESYQYTAEDKENITLSHNAVGTEPPEEYLPENETRLTDDERDQLMQVDGNEFSTESATEFPYHRFDVTVDEAVEPDDEVEIVWNGSSLEGRKVTMYAWNYETSNWEALVTTIAGDEAFELVGSVTGPAYIQDQKISVIVQDQIAGQGENFSMVWMTDTQYYSESYPHIYGQQVEWIEETREALNIEYVFHTGDLVNVYDDFDQWEVADNAMKVLDDAEIPYGVLAGNHDVHNKDHNYENYSEYFGEERFEGRSYYGGSYEDNRGHYDLISVNGNDFIMVYMGWGVDDEGIAWMNEVLAEHPNRKAVLNVHEYLLATGNRSPIGDELFEKVVVPNENVFMVLSGHYHNSQTLIDDIDDDGDGSSDRTVYQLLADYQGGPEGGQGFMRLFHFNMLTDQIEVQTYSPYLDQYNYYDPAEFPGKDEFQMDFDTAPQVKKVATDHVEVNVYTDEVIDVVENVPSGETASVTWNELPPNSEYFWHVVATDQYGGERRSDIWSFLTEEGEVVEPPEVPEVPGDDGDGTPSAPGEDEVVDPGAPGNNGGDDSPLNPSLPGDEEFPGDALDPEMPGNDGEQPGMNHVNNVSVNGNDQGDQGEGESPLFENASSGNGDRSENESGSPLPDTATNLFNYLLIGALLIMTGAAVWIVGYLRRKRALQ
ncbi:lamin tail domain-containing protein [Virgibacillus sp. NKC19-16]|uniref:lamin tail domain-containing protein n=1 Tax=Virgibacillus salidurans TaxID=2831673 RepID=UPI001F2C60D9|nr:lamin tail domain-containing protein [Virgibacillus sp. NKC19-16]UJL45837.1 lamin tail domain-containing protein [Virgibacillus sp. NKC19-16]